MLAYLSFRSSSTVLFDITSTSLPVEPFDLDYDNKTERKSVESTG